MEIRVATLADCEALAAIYKPYVENTDITFEYDVPDAAEFARRMERTLQSYPYLVAVVDDRIVGYAYASAFKGRRAYDWSVETSIYVEMSCHHDGVGTALYTALEDYLRRQNICNLCACIAWPNDPSENFHKKFGYETVAHFHNSGFKGKWIDMIWMEKVLCEHRVPPAEFIPFSKLW